MPAAVFSRLKQFACRFNRERRERVPVVTFA
jgi:hypothetical protein